MLATAAVPLLAILTAAFVLAIAVVAKALTLRSLPKSLRTQDLVPSALVPPVAYAGFAIEVGVTVALLTGSGGRAAVLAAAILFFFFAIVTLVQARRRIGAPCGCLGDAVQLENDDFAATLNAVVAVGLLGVATVAPTAAGAVTNAPAVIWMAAFSLASMYWLALYGRSVARKVDLVFQQVSEAPR